MSDDVDPVSIVPSTIKIDSPAPNIVRFHFVAREKAADLTVYEVNSFRFWNNVEEPFNSVLTEYSGPTYLVYNNIINCAKSIAGIPQNSFVSAFCSEKNYEDQLLTHWTIVMKGDPFTQSAQTQVIESWPLVYVYCYTLNITSQGQTEECPPHAFTIDAKNRWNTSDGYIYSPAAIELLAAERPETITDFIDSVHLRNLPHVVSENKVIKKLREKELELKDSKMNNIAFSVQGTDVQYSRLSNILLGMLLTAIAVFGLIFGYNAHNWSRRQHLLMKTVTDHFDGEGTYDTIRSSKRTKSKKEYSLIRMIKKPSNDNSCIANTVNTTGLPSGFTIS